jgi:hypothetical protein
MTLRKFYIGSHGPFLYDDDDDINDPDGDFSGETHGGIVTDGPVRVGATPTVDNDVLRKSDFEAAYVATDILAKLKTVDGAASGLDADLLDGQHGSYYAVASTVSGTFTTVDGKTVTVTNGVITGIV